MTANHAHTPTDEEMQELFETGAMVTEFAHSRQEATIDWQLWLQERDARIAAAAEQRGAIKALRDAAESHDVIDYMYKHFDNHPIQAPASVRATATYLHNRADRLEGDDDEGDDDA